MFLVCMILAIITLLNNQLVLFHKVDCFSHSHHFSGAYRSLCKFEASYLSVFLLLTLAWLLSFLIFFYFHLIYFIQYCTKGSCYGTSPLMGLKVLQSSLIPKMFESFFTIIIPSIPGGFQWWHMFNPLTLAYVVIINCVVWKQNT
jgi:preprotein translocase subunit SecY